MTCSIWFALWLFLLGAFTGYCWGRAGEIAHRQKERARKAKAYGGQPSDYRTTRRKI